MKLIHSNYLCTILLPIHQNVDIENKFGFTLRSILKNKPKEFKLLLLIDGNLNSSLKNKISYFKKKNNFIVLRSKKVGLTKLLNKGINKTKTSWISRADSDDIYLKDYFFESLKLMKKNYDLFGGQIIEFDDNKKKYFIKKKVPTDSCSIKNSIKFRNPFNHMTVFFKKDLAKKLGGYPEIPFKEDYGLWIKFLSSGAKVCNSNKVFVRVRVNDSFYIRRSGLKHLYSELKIQHLLLTHRLTKIYISIVVFSIRIFFILMPSRIIKIFYQNVLRN
jgi:hypothetical protein